MFDDSWVGDEYLGGLVDYNNEVSEGRRVDVVFGCCIYDDGDLGDNIGGFGVVVENIIEVG